MRRIKRISRKIAKELNISGPFNIQFLARDNDIKVIECNLRASRSFPFVSKLLQSKGYKLFATGGTSRFLTENGVENTLVYWPSEEGMQPQALDMLHRKEIDMVVNLPKNLTAGELTNGYKIRRAAVDLNIPLLTNARLAEAFINAFCSLSAGDIPIKSWDEFKCFLRVPHPITIIADPHAGSAICFWCFKAAIYSHSLNSDNHSED